MFRPVREKMTTMTTMVAAAVVAGDVLVSA
jgi:hypothetical protein